MQANCKLHHLQLMQQDGYGMEHLWCDPQPQTAMQMLSDGEFHQAALDSLTNEADSFLVTDDPPVTGDGSDAKDTTRSVEQNLSSAGSVGNKRKLTDSPSWPGWKGAEWTGVVDEDIGSILNHYTNGELAEKYPHIPVLRTWPSKIKWDKFHSTYPNLAKFGEDAASRFSIAVEDDVFAPRYFVRDPKHSDDKRHRSEVYKCSGQSPKAAQNCRFQTQYGTIQFGKVTWNNDDRPKMLCHMTEYKFVADVAPAASASSDKNIRKACSLVVIDRYQQPRVSRTANMQKTVAVYKSSEYLHAHDSCASDKQVRGRDSSENEQYSKVSGICFADVLSKASRSPPFNELPDDDFHLGDALPSPVPLPLPLLCLSEQDCDLDFIHEGSGQYRTMTEGWLARMWSGARASIGLCTLDLVPDSRVPKYMFEVRILNELSHESHQNLCRIGWSCVESPTYALGEIGNGWGYGGTGKKSHGGKFEDFGEPFGLGDVIGCGLDLQTNEIWYAKNGRSLGPAFTIDFKDSTAKSRGIFPHVLIKNVRVEVAFGPLFDKCVHELGELNFLPMVEALSCDGVTTHPSPLLDKPEVIMLVGLPKVGKTKWALNHIVQHPEKRFYVLSTNDLMPRIKGLSTFTYSESEFHQHIAPAAEVLDKFLELAPTRRRNYIWDQTNISSNIRMDKLKHFQKEEMFTISAQVFVIPDEELRHQTRIRENDAKERRVPLEVLMRMMLHFELPTQSEGFDQVEYCGRLSQEEAALQVERDRHVAQEWLARNIDRHKYSSLQQEVAELRAQVQKSISHDRDRERSKDSSKYTCIKCD